MSFSMLPLELLPPILLDKNIPLQQKIRLRRVAKNWQSTIEAYLAKTTKLVVHGNRDARRRAQNDLVVSKEKFTAELVQLLTRLFPGIKELTVDIFSQADYENLPEFLQFYEASLKTLSLSGQQTQRGLIYRINATPSLATALNRLSRLTDLEISGYRVNNGLLRLLSPTLGRLERFALEHERSNVVFGYPIFSSLSSRCTILQLPAIALFWLNATVGRAITELVVDDVTSSLIDCLVGHIRGDVGPGLRRLVVNFDRLPYSTLRFRAFAPLPQITKLEINGLKFTAHRPPAPSAADRRLVNIRHLTLTLTVDYSSRFIVTEKAIRGLWTRLAEWFPALERLTIQSTDVFYHILKTVLENLNTGGRCVIRVVLAGRHNY